MTDRQEADLRDAFETALQLLRRGRSISRIENIYAGTGDSAVILVVGKDDTFEAVRAVDKLMDRWDSSGG